MTARDFDVSRIINEARIDPELFSKIDVNVLLESLESTQNDFLEGHTIDSIAENVFHSLKRLEFVDDTNLPEFCRKLVGYRHVDELHLLHKGKYVRWIRKDTPTPQLMAGGIVVDVKFGDAGVNVLVRTTSGRFTQYRFDKCLTYQKLTDEEQLILMLYERVN